LRCQQVEPCHNMELRSMDIRNMEDTLEERLRRVLLVERHEEQVQELVLVDQRQLEEELQMLSVQVELSLALVNSLLLNDELELLQNLTLVSRKDQSLLPWLLLEQEMQHSMELSLHLLKTLKLLKAQEMPHLEEQKTVEMELMDILERLKDQEDT
jgi:hypothetical protein